MVIYRIRLQQMTTWPIFPLISQNYLQLDFFFQHGFLIPTMTLATICRNGSKPFERTLTVLTACLYHLSSSILHSFTFLFSLSFTFFHSHFPSYTFHFSISLTFIHLYLFSFTFILICSTSFTFIHTHFGSLTFYLSPYIGLPDLPSFTSISLHPLSSTFISLLFPSSAYIYHHLIVFIYLHLPPLVFIKIVRDYPTNYRAVSLIISG